MRDRLKIYRLMYKREGNQDVWLYDKFRKKEIETLTRNGWRVER